MSNSEKYRFADFTRENYRRLLKLAKEKYNFCDFENFKDTKGFVIWRHDIDFSVHSSRALAEIEASESVSSTFFIHLHNDFYNVLEKEITDLLREILAMGHKAGLHFDCHYYAMLSQPAVEEKLKLEKELLENILGVSINVFSFHNPTDEILSAFTAESYVEMINTYSSYFRNNTGYCSDSNGYWRFERLEDVLKSGKHENLQVLTHPAWWQEEILSPKQRIWRCIDGRAEKTKQKYSRTLKDMGRENIDE